MKSDKIIRILVIDDSSNDAETVANMLRNAGHAVHASRIEDDEDLRGALAEHHWDLVLSKPEIPFFNCIDALDVITNTEIDLPLLIIADDASHDQIENALKNGARDAVLLSQATRLRYTVLREVDDLHKRQRHRRCEALLAEANERAQSLVDSSRDAIAYVHEGMHIYANSSYLNMFGYSDFSELEGLPIMDMVAGDDQGKFKDFLRRYIKGGTDSDTIQLHGLKADREPFEITMEFASASYEGEPCTQIVIRDQTLSKELEKKLDDLSKQDLLTGVYNRQYFLEALKAVVGKAGKRGAMLYLRPDDFKDIRQNIGIAASDMVLTDIASLIDSQLTGDDLVARFESNIFTVLLHGVSNEQAETIAGRIRDAVGAHIADAGGNSVTTTCTIGVALFTEALHNPHELVTRAEKAYAQAADRGQGQVAIYQPAAGDLGDREKLALWEKRLKNALRSNSFRLLYQPLISLRGETAENYEVLLRMLDEDGTEVPPHEFIPAAERTNLMLAVDRWVLANAVKILTERRRAGRKTNFFIKISAASLTDARFLPWLRDLLKAARLDANTLTVEISEAVASHHIKALKVLFDGLGQLRVRAALDHVGLAPNYANLLKHCSADFVKVDGSIVAAITRDGAAKDKLQGVVALAKETEKQVIAEFVEDAQTLAALWTSGADYIQGHFLQPPTAEMDYDFSSAG